MNQYEQKIEGLDTRNKILEDFRYDESIPLFIREDEPDAFFEHGQWWVHTMGGASWSVVECEDIHGETRVEFEQIDEGDYGL